MIHDLYPRPERVDLPSELAVFRVLAERTLRQEHLQLEFHHDIQRHPISAVHDCFL